MKTYKERTQQIMQKVQKEKAKRAKRGWIAFAIAAAVITSVNLVLFTPYNTSPVELTAHKQSEYYGLMNKVNELTYSPPRYKNNFDKWFGSFSFGCGAKDLAMGGNMMGAVPENSMDMIEADNVAGKYEEVTNNQTKGVIEGDLFKRTSEYIFYLNYQQGDYVQGAGYSAMRLDYQLQIYSIEKENSEKVGSITIKAEEGMRFNGYTDKAELYLSQDGKQATVVSPCYDTNNTILYTAVMSFDVSDVTDVKELGRTYVSGNYVSSRKVENSLYLVSNYYLQRNPDFNKPEKYLPQVGSRYALNSIKAEDIIWSEDATSAQYTVLCKIDCATLETQDSLAFFSYSEEIYASKENMFITRSYLDTTQDGEKIARKSMTEIACINYSGEELVLKGSVVLDGYVNDQYSMDEYDGVLRVFTTHSSNEYIQRENGGYTSMQFVASAVSANLYCVDLQTLTTVAAVEKFAPSGETVRSARFEGTKAYVCTAIRVTDPVFAFDLSNLSNITYTDTGVIDGYSISLVKFAGDTLLGIGYNEQMNLKIELYRETATELASVTSYEPTEYFQFSQEFKAYYIDSQNGYIGLLDNYLGNYVLLQFDGYNLVEVLKTEFSGYADRTRATMIDGWLYIVGDQMMKAVNVI